jgi:hypothetical protein
MSAAHQLLQSNEFPLLRRERRAFLARLVFLKLELFLLLFDLYLLLFESVDEDGRKLIVFDAFDLALCVAEGQPRLDLLDFFSAKADVLHTVLLPRE